jgi:GT2 family glycosyltransferase
MRLCIVTADLAGPGCPGAVEPALASLLPGPGERAVLLHARAPWRGAPLVEEERARLAARGLDLVLLPAQAEVPLIAGQAVAEAYMVDRFLRAHERDFDEVRFVERGGAGFYALLAGRHGLAYGATRLTLARTGATFDPRPPASIDDLERDFLERESGRLAGEPAPAATPRRPSISVCLVHRDRPAFLAQALESIAAQTEAPLEVVLVDDGSETAEAHAALAALAPAFEARGWRLVRQENRYLGAARNAAARLARGEYLLFMDDDNLALPDEVATFARAAARSGADILTCFMDLFGGREPLPPGAPPRARALFLGGAAAVGLFRNAFGDANALVRREAFLALGGFTEDRDAGYEDWEFFARAVLAGLRLEVVPEPLFRYRVSDASMSRATREAVNTARRIRPYLDAVPPALRPALRLLAGARRPEGRPGGPPAAGWPEQGREGP